VIGGTAYHNRDKLIRKPAVRDCMMGRGLTTYQTGHILGDSECERGIPGGVSNVDMDGNNTLQIKGIGLFISTF